MPEPRPTWLTDFASAVDRDDFESAVAAIDSQKTEHAGTANAADKRAAAREIRRVLVGTPDALFHWAQTLAEHESPTARELGSVLLPHVYQNHADDVMSILQKVADDDHWEVREWAAGGAGDIFATHFKEALQALESWSTNSSQHVRRAAP